MNEYYFTVSCRGKFMFRTDCMNAEDAARNQACLANAFTREDGYRVDKAFRPSFWTVQEAN